MYLVDTDVVSVLRRPERQTQVARWFTNQIQDDLYISIMTIGEIERGAANVQDRDPTFARVLSKWLMDVIKLFGDNILTIDIPTVRRWGRLSAALGNRNTDLFIAATALEHDLTVVTRNVRHFEPTGVRLVNPFEV